MLTYIEQVEQGMRKSAADASQNRRKNSEGVADEAQEKEDDLAQITGGKDAEIEQYVLMLHKIAEENLIQDGLLGKFLDPIRGIAQSAQQRYSGEGAQESNQFKVSMPEICILERSAILALCKFMCVSSLICK